MSQLVVRGGASAEELAAVLAALEMRRNRTRADGYARWRATRLAAVRRAADQDERG